MTAGELACWPESTLSDLEPLLNVVRQVKKVHALIHEKVHGAAIGATDSMFLSAVKAMPENTR